MQITKDKIFTIVFLGFALIVAFILRLISANNFGDFCLDELVSWYFASFDSVFQTIIEAFKQDVHAPLFYIILHFWIKIFSSDDLSQRICTILTTLPLIPLAYFFAKDIFNKNCAIFSVIFFAISTFCINYSVFVRFYGLVMVLSLFCAYYFVKMLLTFDKKYIFGFAISNSLLIYTYSFTPMLSFCYFVVGLFYVLKFNKQNFKKFINSFLLLGILSLPVLIFIPYTMFYLKNNALSYFGIDINYFLWVDILNIFDNFFTSQNYPQDGGFFEVLFQNLHQPLWAFFVFIPLLIACFGFFKSIFTKNHKVLLFLIPSFLFLVFAVILGHFHIIQFMSRHAAIIYSVFVVAMCQGLSSFKFKYLQYLLFGLLILFNLMYYVISPSNVFTRNHSSSGNLEEVIYNIVRPTNDDLFLIPYSGSKLSRYIKKGKLIRFFMDDAVLLKDQASKLFYFGKISNKITRENVKYKLKNHVLQNIPFEAFEENLYKNYISKMKKGQKLTIILFRKDSVLSYMNAMNNHVSEGEYYSFGMFNFLVAKATQDSLIIANKYLKQINYFDAVNRNYSMFVFEKE